MLYVEGPVASAPHASARRGPCRWPRASGGTSVRRHPCPSSCWASLFLAVAAICPQDTGWPRSSAHRGGPVLPLLPVTPTFHSLGSRPGEGKGVQRTCFRGGAGHSHSCSRPSCPRTLDPRSVLTHLCSQALTPRLGTGRHEQPQLPPDWAWGALVSRTDPGGEGHLVLSLSTLDLGYLSDCLRSS